MSPADRGPGTRILPEPPHRLARLRRGRDPVPRSTPDRRAGSRASRGGARPLRLAGAQGRQAGRDGRAPDGSSRGVGARRGSRAGT